MGATERRELYRIRATLQGQRSVTPAAIDLDRVGRSFAGASGHALHRRS